jgi:plastocyanin
MHGSVRVVDGDLPKTPDQVQAQGNAQLAAEMARAGKLDAQFAAQPGSNQALAGAGDKTIEFAKFYPSQINATVGVPLMFTDLDKHEPHTVSFGAVPGDPRDPATGVFPSGANPNAFDGTSALNSGFLFYKSQYEYWNIKNSPLAAAQPKSTFSLTFTKAGKYNYYCEIHGGFDPTTGQVFGMSGTITVAAG